MSVVKKKVDLSALRKVLYPPPFTYGNDQRIIASVITMSISLEGMSDYVRKRDLRDPLNRSTIIKGLEMCRNMLDAIPPIVEPK